jgi:hypothetical protein
MKIYRHFFLVFFVIFYFCTNCYPLDKKEIMREYLEKINPALAGIQAVSRNLSMRLIPLESALKETESYIGTIDSVSPPEFMLKEHKLILLSFKKLRMSFYVMTKGNKDVSIRLARSGRDLLRMAVANILEFSKKEGLIEEKKEGEGEKKE